MEKLERLEAEVEAMKIVCASITRHLGRFAWSEARLVANAAIARHAEMLEATSMTDLQLSHMKEVVAAAFGSEVPAYEPQVIAPSRKSRQSR